MTATAENNGDGPTMVMAAAAAAAANAAATAATTAAAAAGDAAAAAAAAKNDSAAADRDAGDGVRPYDADNMRLALEQSAVAYRGGCMPFGAALCGSDGTVTVRACNVVPAGRTGRRGGTQSAPCDPTGHAEIALLRTSEFMALPRSERLASTLYSSTEPCVMCAGAIYWSGIGRVVFGCSAADLESTVSGPGGFDIPIRQLYSTGRPELRRPIQVVGPLLGEEALQIHRDSGVWNTAAGTSGSDKEGSGTAATTTIDDSEGSTSTDDN